MALPRLTRAQVPLTQAVRVRDETGAEREIHIPAERPLTLFVDRRELVTLMTLGAEPELLVLGWLRNQRMLSGPAEVHSVTVDWEVGAAAVRTHHGIEALDQRTERRTVTTGCGQGTVYGDLMAQLDDIELPPPEHARIGQATLRAMLERIRVQDSVYRRAGSVHGCALFQGAEMLFHIEDVGRHNAIDTLAGWMWMRGVAGGDKSLYTTGRLTSEMILKAAQMGVPIVVSRNGITQMGHALATQLGVTLFGRAANRHFLCYTGFERFDAEPSVIKADAPSG